MKTQSYVGLAEKLKNRQKLWIVASPDNWMNTTELQKRLHLIAGASRSEVHRSPLIDNLINCSGLRF